MTMHGSGGVIGGELGYRLLRRIAAQGDDDSGYCSGSAQAGPKLEAQFGQTVWDNVEGKTVIDFGCGFGHEAIEMARHGARQVIGIDNRQRVLDEAAAQARQAGLDNCEFRLSADQQVDTIFSIDGFEHYGEPEQILQLFRRLIKPEGRILISFGPPWLHPYGGHLFSVFPWAHLIFSEKALIRWRSDFKSDGAERFCEVEGGLNLMTVGQFRRLVKQSDFRIESFQAVPIRKLRWLSNPLTREYLTSVVHCTLRPEAAAASA